jgi:hypothetical protein
MRKAALALVTTLMLAGCGTTAMPLGAPTASGSVDALAKAATPAAVFKRFEALATKHVPEFDAKLAEHREALLDVAGYESADKPGKDRPLTAEKLAMIETYLKAIASAKLKPEAVTFGILRAIKDHTNYAFPERGESIYADGSAAHLRIFKKYIALVVRYEVRQQAVAISRFMGLAYGAKNGGSEQGVAVLESYMAALDKAGFAVRDENFALMNFSGRGGLVSLLGTMSFEPGPGDASNVGPAFAKKALPKVLAALKGKERTATADDVEEALKSLAR